MKHSLICANCGCMFLVSPSDSQRRETCSKQCQRQLYYKLAVARFLDDAVRVGECWLWKPQHKTKKYGRVSVAGRTVSAHRLAYELTHGPIPKGMWVLHRCDNPRCVRPDHLFLGTHDDNMNDMVSKRRSLGGDRHPSRQKPERFSRGEKHGSAKLTEAQAVEVARALAQGETHAALARRYGVNESSIWKIARGMTWRHVPGVRAALAALEGGA